MGLFHLLACPPDLFEEILMTSASDEIKEGRLIFPLICGQLLSSTTLNIYKHTDSDLHIQNTPISPGFRLWCDAFLILLRRLHRGGFQPTWFTCSHKFEATWERQRKSKLGRRETSIQKPKRKTQCSSSTSSKHKCKHTYTTFNILDVQWGRPPCMVLWI